MTQTRVLIVAAAPTARIELRSILEADDEHDFEVVGEAASMEVANGLAEADVLLLADESSLEEVERNLPEDGTQTIVAISSDETPVARLRRMSLLGWGIVTPDAPPEEISAAIHAVARGLVVLPEALAERLLDESFPDAPAAVVDELSEPLTPREREVLELLGRGLSNRLIAGELHISEHTVKFHVSSVYAKLGVGTRAGAVSQGARRGLISL